MKVRSFSHTALTVADFDKTVQFYWEIFGCPVVAVGETPTERIRAFFGVDAEEPKLKIGWIRVPGGAVLEIFEFQPQQLAQQNRLCGRKDLPQKRLDRRAPPRQPLVLKTRANPIDLPFVVDRK